MQPKHFKGLAQHKTFTNLIIKVEVKDLIYYPTYMCKRTYIMNILYIYNVILYIISRLYKIHVYSALADGFPKKNFTS